VILKKAGVSVITTHIAKRSQHAPSGRMKTVLLIIGILLIAANLRASLTGLGPLVGDIRSQTNLSNSITGMLTSIPLLAFAILSPLVPRIARRFGMELSLMASLILLTIGIIVRSLSSVTLLFVGTFIIGLAIAVGNVLLPSLVKRDFPNQVGAMTGAYSVGMNVFGALASGISVPLSIGIGLGWRGSLACWACLAGIAVICWLPQLRSHHIPEAPRKGVSIWGSALAWQVTLFMGLQSFLFYINVTWLPVILHDRGMSITSSGWMLSVMQFICLPVAFLVPLLASRRSNQRGIVIFTVLFHLIGYIGLLSGIVALTWICIICIGIAVGSSISLALAFFGLRTQNASQAAELSGMAQSIGYLLAAIGPILFGYLHDLTHAWFIPLMIMVIACLLLLYVGLGAGRNAFLNSNTSDKSKVA
jgi:CP family cyanate transporter-like MFS transporter